MVQIHLHEFQNYSFPQLLQFVHLQEDPDYLLTLPKTSIAYKLDNIDVFWEYYNAAFVGQQLWLLSSSFAYTVPCMLTPGKFIFQFIAMENEKLAETLYSLVNWLYTKENKILCEEFHGHAAQLFTDAFDDKNDIACYGLIWIAYLFVAN